MRHYNDSPDQSPMQLAFIRQYLRKKRLVSFLRITIFVLFVGSWEFCCRLGILDSFLFSSPSRLGQCFLTMLRDGSILYHIGVTVTETLVSFALVIGLGIGISVVLWWNETIARVLDPYLSVLNSLPKSALAPIFIVWFGNNMKTIIICAISVAVFGCIMSLYHAFLHTEEDKSKLIVTLGGTRGDVLRKVILPGNVPAILSVMKVNIGLSLVGVIIGEFLAAKAGLGYLIIYGSQVFKLDYVMLSICILCLVATGLYQLLGLLERRVQNSKSSMVGSSKTP